MKMQFSDWAMVDDTFNQLRVFSEEETGEEPVVVTLQFRRATMGGIVNTLVDGEPVITTNGW